MIRIDLAKLRFPYHMTYAGLGPVMNLHISTFTRILQNENGFYATQEHSTPPPCVLLADSQDVYTLLSLSLHSQCMDIHSNNAIAKVPGLLEYVAYTTSHNHKQPYNERSLINTGGTSMTRQTCLSKNTYLNINSGPVSI